MVCEIVGFVTAILLPSNEPLLVQKIECWAEVKKSKHSIEYQVIEGLEGVEVLYYDKQNDLYYVTIPKVK